jgi:hypothetical protein
MQHGTFMKVTDVLFVNLNRPGDCTQFAKNHYCAPGAVMFRLRSLFVGNSETSLYSDAKLCK